MGAADDGSFHSASATLVIFGITGDLAQRKLLPAIYHLFKDNLLDEHTRIVGISRRDVNIDEVIKTVELCVLEDDKVCDPQVVKRMQGSTEMLQMDLHDPAAYEQLRTRLDELEQAEGVCMNRLFYLAIPPASYQAVVRLLGEHGLSKSCPHGTGAARLLVEKPFGYDVPSAQELIDETAKQFDEQQIFRIDHYLAKETAQNILAFRMHNPIFTDIWDSQHIAHIGVVATEKIGIEGRGQFYEGVGALRDLVQSHLLQLLALIMMEPPSTLENSDDIHTERYKLLSSLHVIPSAGTVVRGQYTGYREEVGNPASTTETFVSLRLFADNKRWQHTPITITTGKGLHDKQTTITLTFKSAGTDTTTNALTFRIQPNEGIDIQLAIKKPGFVHELQRVRMDFSYKNVFTHHTHPDAYERVLVDAIHGDRTLFATSRGVLAAWQVLQPVLDFWQQGTDKLKPYDLGSRGPLLPEVLEKP